MALLFQSILTEDRIPASERVWFARLQMPVLRVAVSEPDFFATIDHPARRLIDRMFGGRLTPLVAHLAERDQLSQKDIAEIEALLKELKS